MQQGIVQVGHDEGRPHIPLQVRVIPVLAPKVPPGVGEGQVTGPLWEKVGGCMKNRSTGREE